MPIQFREEDKGKILEVHVSGSLVKEDYARFVPEFERLVRLNGKLRLLFDMEDFKGWDAGAAWEDFKFPSHMETVEPGNAIFMFAKGVGIIGVGLAEGPCEKLTASQPGRLSHVHTDVEWRVPARWLVWTDKDRAFHWNSPNFTFWDVTESQYDEFRADVMAHFFADG